MSAWFATHTQARAFAWRSWYLAEITVWEAGNEDDKFHFPFYGWLDARIEEDGLRAEIWHDPFADFRYLCAFVLCVG